MLLLILQVLKEPSSWKKKEKAFTRRWLVSIPNSPAEVTVESGVVPPPPPPQTLVVGSTSNRNCSDDVEELLEFHLSPQDCPPQPSSTPLQFHINPPLPPAPCDNQYQNHNNINLIHQMAHDQQQQHQHSNWENGYQDFVNLGSNSSTTPDLLSLLHLPRCSLPQSMLPNSFSDIMSSSSAAASVMYNPLFHLNFPLQTRDQRNNSCFLGVEDQIQMDANIGGGGGGINMMYYEGVNNNDSNNGGFDNGVIEFSSGGNNRKGRRGSRKSRTFPTERERRVHFNDRFFDLKNLIPNPTKVNYFPHFYFEIDSCV
ncbi:hypothetical protein Bca4012_037529 [Brassica carinata]